MMRLLLTLLLFCGLQARVADVDVLPSFSQGSLNQDQRNLGLYLSQLSSVLSAGLLQQDMQAALASGTIAAQENAFFVPLILVGLSAYEAYDLYQTYQRDGAEAALTQAGISIGLAASGGVVVKYGGKLGSKVVTKVYPNLHQAWLGLVESNPILSKVIAVADGGINAIKQLDSQASQAVGKLWRGAGGKSVGGGVGKVAQKPGVTKPRKAKTPHQRMQAKIKGKGIEEHHIVSDKHPRTKNHPLFERAGISQQDRINKMLLPKRKGVELSTTNRSIHDGKHYSQINKQLAEEMDKAEKLGERFGWSQEQYKDELTKILSRERSALRSGERALNKHQRPWAKPLEKLGE